MENRLRAQMILGSWLWMFMTLHDADEVR